MKKLVILIGMPGSGKTFVAEQLQKSEPRLQIANSSDALVKIIAGQKGLTTAQILAKKEVYRQELIELGDKLSRGGNLIMHYACRGVDILTGVRRISELEAVHCAQNLQILTVYVASDVLCIPDNLDICPSHCDFILWNPRSKVTIDPAVDTLSNSDEFKQIIDFLN